MQFHIVAGVLEFGQTTQDLTLLDVLDQLGGPTPLAEWDRSYVQRESGNKIAVMLRQLWNERDLQFDIQLEPGDLVVVPIKALRVYVAGEVSDAGAVPSPARGATTRRASPQSPRF